MQAARRPTDQLSHLSFGSNDYINKLKCMIEQMEASEKSMIDWMLTCSRSYYNPTHVCLQLVINAHMPSAR